MGINHKMFEHARDYIALRHAAWHNTSQLYSAIPSHSPAGLQDWDTSSVGFLHAPTSIWAGSRSTLGTFYTHQPPSQPIETESPHHAFSSAVGGGTSLMPVGH